MRRFESFRRLVIEHAAKVGKRDARCNWQDLERTLEMHEKSSVQVLYPEDEHIPMSEYLEEFGDPKTNGHDHKRFNLDDVDGMLVPVSKRARVMRKKSMDVVKKTIVDGTDQEQIGDRQIEDKFNDIQSSFFNMFKSSGTTLDKLVGRKQAPAVGTGASTTEPEAPAHSVGASSSSVPSANSSVDGFGGLVSGSTFFGLSPSVPASIPRSAPPNASRAQKRTPKKKAQASKTSVAVGSPGVDSTVAPTEGEARTAESRKPGRPARDLVKLVDEESAELAKACTNDTPHDTHIVFAMAWKHGGVVAWIFRNGGG